MSVVVINAVTVPQEMREVFEQRFAQRKGAVEQQEGFEEFQLLRPSGAEGRYFVYTRWATQQAYEAWLSSQSFAQAHGGERAGPGGGGGGGGPGGGGGHPGGPVGAASELLEFEVIERVTK